MSNGKIALVLYGELKGKKRKEIIQEGGLKMAWNKKQRRRKRGEGRERARECGGKNRAMQGSHCIALKCLSPHFCCGF